MNECEISQAQGQGARRGLLGRMAGRAVSPQSRLSSPRRVGRRDSRRAPRRATSLRSRLSCGRAGVNDNARNAKKSRATSGTVCSQLTRPRRSIHTDASDDAHMSLSVRSSPHASTLLTLHAKLCARSPSRLLPSLPLAWRSGPSPPPPSSGSSLPQPMRASSAPCRTYGARSSSKTISCRRPNGTRQPPPDLLARREGDHSSGGGAASSSTSLPSASTLVTMLRLAGLRRISMGFSPFSTSTATANRSLSGT